MTKVSSTADGSNPLDDLMRKCINLQKVMITTEMHRCVLLHYTQKEPVKYLEII